MHDRLMTRLHAPHAPILVLFYPQPFPFCFPPAFAFFPPSFCLFPPSFCLFFLTKPGISLSFCHGRVATYFFDQPGKRFRPAIILLVSKVPLHITSSFQYISAHSSVFRCFEHPCALFSCSPSCRFTFLQPRPSRALPPNHRALSPKAGPKGPGEHDISERQHRLAEITEMIHTASLMHDDVMDHATHRRGVRTKLYNPCLIPYELYAILCSLFFVLDTLHAFRIPPTLHWTMQSAGRGCITQILRDSPKF